MQMEICKYHAVSAQAKAKCLGLFVETISIGIHPVVAAKNGHPKLGAAVVRVKGFATEAGSKRIDDVVGVVILELEQGNYGGPKTLNAHSAYAETLLPLVHSKRGI